MGIKQVYKRVKLAQLLAHLVTEDAEVVVDAPHPGLACVLNALADPRDVCVALGVERERDALRDADVRHLERDPLRRAHLDRRAVAGLVELERGVVAAEVRVDVVAVVAGAELQRRLGERHRLVADVHLADTQSVRCLDLDIFNI